VPEVEYLTSNKFIKIIHESWYIKLALIFHRALFNT
jgi:hypothetical protein